MLITDDPQLPPVNTPHGSLMFLQVVGVCTEELKAAQHWNGPGVVEFIKSIPSAGGAWLITDMRRGETIFDLNPELQEELDEGIERDGSNLSGVSGCCSWEEDLSFSHGYDDDQSDKKRRNEDDDKENYAGVQTKTSDSRERNSKTSSEDEDRHHLSSRESELIKKTLSKGLGTTRPVLPAIKQEVTSDDSTTINQQKASSSVVKESFDNASGTDASSELLRIRTFDSVHIKLNLETGAVLPLALRGRLKHGRHFTFKNAVSDSAITLVASSVSGSIANEQTPYAAHGSWLQVLLIDDFMDTVLCEVSNLSDLQETLTSPRVYSWPDHRLTITILPDTVA